jgi:hypothetical protein
MFEAFGFTRVPLLMKADWMNYKNILMTYGPAKKIRVQDPNVKFEDGKIPPYITSSFNAAISVSDGELKVEARDGGRGLFILPTARIPKGDFLLFEADISIRDISGEGKFTFENRTGSISRVERAVYFDIYAKDGKLTFVSDKWATGFKAEAAASQESFKLRVEISLTDAPRLDGAKRKCTTMDVYADGKYLGRAMNDDGRDPAYPSGFCLGTNTRIFFGTAEGTDATITLRSLRHSYANK